jgi:hypothetical protein
MAPMTRISVQRVEQFVQQHRLAVVQFAKGQRKDDVMKEHLGRFTQDEGVVDPTARPYQRLPTRTACLTHRDV